MLCTDGQLRQRVCRLCFVFAGVIIVGDTHPAVINTQTARGFEQRRGCGSIVARRQALQGGDRRQGLQLRPCAPEIARPSSGRRAHAARSACRARPAACCLTEGHRCGNPSGESPRALPARHPWPSRYSAFPGCTAPALWRAIVPHHCTPSCDRLGLSVR